MTHHTSTVSLSASALIQSSLLKSRFQPHFKLQLISIINKTSFTSIQILKWRLSCIRFARLQLSMQGESKIKSKSSQMQVLMTSATRMWIVSTNESLIN